MSNADLIERLRKSRTPGFPGVFDESADALAAADKRIAELEARCRWHEEGSASIVGYPWDTPFQDGLKTGRRELLDDLHEAERKLSVAREALKQIPHALGHDFYAAATTIADEALAQIGGVTPADPQSTPQTPGSKSADS